MLDEILGNKDKAFEINLYDKYHTIHLQSLNNANRLI